MNEKITIGYGYRRMEVGETLSRGDEFYDDVQGCWRFADNYTFGQKIGPTWATHRRPINAGEGYRLLTGDEIIRYGDEFCDVSSDWRGKKEWYEVCDSIGCRVEPRAVELSANAFRRKVELVCTAGTSATPPEHKATFYVLDERNGYFDPEVYSTEEKARTEAQRRAMKYGTPQLVLRSTLRASISTSVTTSLSVLY